MMKRKLKNKNNGFNNTRINVIKSIALIAFICAFMINNRLIVNADSGVINSFKILQTEDGLGMGISENLSLGETGDASGIATSFNLTNDSSGEHKLIFYVPGDINKLYTEGICAASKHVFSFYYYGGTMKYEHKVYKYDSGSIEDNKWINVTASYRQVTSKMPGNAPILKRSLLDENDPAAYIGGSYDGVNTHGEYYTINDINYAFFFELNGESATVYTYRSTENGLRDYLFDVTLQDSRSASSSRTLYNAKNLSCISKAVTVSGEEYVCIQVDTPYSHNGAGEIIKRKMPDDCVANIQFVVRKENELEKLSSELTPKFLSNQSKVQSPLNYYDDNTEDSKKKYYNLIKTSDIKFEPNDDGTERGSQIYYVCMEPKRDVTQQITYIQEVRAKGFTFPQYYVERRNIKENYIKIEPYHQNGTYEIDLGICAKDSAGNIKKDMNGDDVVEWKKNYSSQYVQYVDEITTQRIMIPIGIDISNNLTYKVNVRYKPEGEMTYEGEQVEVSKESEPFTPKDDTNVNIGVALRQEVNNIIVINDTEGKPIVAQFDLTFDVPEGIFELFYGNYGKYKKINSIGIDHNLWFELYINKVLDKDNNNQKYAVADIIYMDFIEKSNISNSYFYVYTQNTTKNIGPEKGGHTWTGRVNYTDDKMTVRIVLRPSDDENFDGYSYGFFSFYEPQFEYLDTETEGIKILQSGTVPETVGKYEQYLINGGDEGKSNDYFRFSPENKIPTDGSANYYLYVKTLFKANNDGSDDVINVSDDSVSINVVFQANSDVIPVTDNLKFETQVNSNNIDLSNEIAGVITGVDGTAYYKKMLQPLGTELEETKFEVLISEDLDTLRYVMEDEVTALERNDLIVIDGDDYSYANPVKFKTSVDYKNDFNINYLRNHCITNASSISKGVYAFYTNDLLPIGVTDVDKKFISNDGKIYIQGLDSNTTYYIVIRTAFNVGTSTNPSYRYSDFSKIFSKSTSTKPVVPTQKEIYPAAPEHFERATDIIFDDTKGGVKFRAPSSLDRDTYEYAYELVRIADERLSEENKSQELTMNDLYKLNLSQFVGARIDKDAASGSKTPKELLLFENGKYDFATGNPLYSLSDRVASDSYEFIDKGLKPNRIYFYYVRTVQKVIDEDGNITGELYSEWAEVTITTIPIEGIINLKEVPVPAKDPYFVQEFNSYYERVISFDAPKAQPFTYFNGRDNVLVDDDEKLPDGKDFIISIKQADEEEYYNTSSIKLEARINNPDSEFDTYVYRLQKLKSGTKYNVRVAAVDTSIVEDDGNYPVSTFSNSISIRTEFNQDDYNRETKYKEYETYYNAKLGKINNDLGFVLEDSTSNYIVKFKEDKFQGALAASKETTYMLPTNDDAYMFTYYISNANIKEMMRLKKGLRLDHDGTTVVIPYNFINDDYNKFYMDLLKNCDSIKSDVEDFYMKLWIGFSKPQNYIDGNKTTSDQVQISIKFTELDSYNADLDGQLETDIDEYIEMNKGAFFEDVKKQLNNEIDDAKLIEYVDDEENEIREYIQKLANSYYSDYEIESYNMSDLYNDINIKFKTYDTASKIYTKAPNDTKWSQVRTTNSNGYANGYISKLGSTVLTSSADNNIIYGTEETANAYYAKSKYNLDSLLVQNGVFNPKQDKVSESLFDDVAFAILQTDTDDVFNLAKQKQILDNSFAFFNDPLTRQEILYGIMQIYDEFNSVNVNQVVINNANLATGIQFNNYYKQSILAGYQMGLFTLDEIKNPTGYMSIDEMLNIIYRVIG